MRAIADREQFIQIPYLGARGLHGKLARGLQALKEAVTAADALAAEQKAAQDQYRSSSFAQKWFIDTFNKSERGLNAAITEIDEAAHSLRITAGTMLDQADKTQQQSAAMSEMAEAANGGVSTVAERSANLTAMANQLQLQVGNAKDVTTNAVERVSLAGLLNSIRAAKLI